MFSLLVVLFWSSAFLSVGCQDISILGYISPSHTLVHSSSQCPFFVFASFCPRCKCSFFSRWCCLSFLAIESSLVARLWNRGFSATLYWISILSFRAVANVVCFLSHTLLSVLFIIPISFGPICSNGDLAGLPRPTLSLSVNSV